jgi:cyclic beta-1,2-glucan synthetase
MHIDWKSGPDTKDPIRAELLSAEKLIEHAKALAASQPIDVQKRPDLRLLSGLKETTRVLHEAYRSINEAILRGEPIPPAEEWLVDNFHVVSEQLRSIREDLPRHFYLELPTLASGQLRGYPRVYGMALPLIAHTDSRLDAQSLKQFIESYQTVSVLTTGELWALAILLRVGLIENLRRLILASEKDRRARAEADRFADRLLASAAKSSEELQRVLDERSQDQGRMRGAFAAQLMRRLREGGPGMAPTLEWLYDRVSQEGTNLDEMIRQDHQDLAAAQVSVGNTILSLRLLATMNWAELVEETSQVDVRLRRDPSGFYARCDFATRDRYRHVIEEIAKGARKPEIDVADTAIHLALASWQRDATDERRGHVGYYLIDKGRKELERQTHFRPSLVLRIKRIDASWPFLFYQIPIAVMTAAIVLILIQYGWTQTQATWLVLMIALVCLIPASALSLTLEHWMRTLLVKPKILPKLDLKDGIPPELRTFVVLPTILAPSSDLRELLARLEVHYLANNDDALDFALLLDYPDAETETTPSDEKSLQEAMDGISALNQKYPRPDGPRFHLYHRIRKWNESEGKWMGWERKRGKLEEFNRWLKGATDTTYVAAKLPSGIKFVITLDSDTILPREAARKLLGTLAHPLNRAGVDSRTRHVVQGYGILQPRVSHTLASANRTWFSKIFSGPTGIDPYTTAVSDIYQDLFEEASFIGKGIYDLDAFDASLTHRFPENALLSHDLIEGAFARTALVSDVEIFDDHPSDYTAYMLRLHRWVRGDWQVARWLRPRVPRADGSKAPNTLSWLNRWKLFDNLRRSLVSPSLFLALLCGWTIFPGSPWIWSLFVLGVLFAPLVVQLVSGIFSRPRGLPWRNHLRALTNDAGMNTLKFLLTVSFLPYEAWVLSDAIIRTLFRMARGRKLLEWTTAAQAEWPGGRPLKKYLGRMFRSPMLAAFGLAAVLGLRPSSLFVALPFLLSWVAAPVLAYWTGRPIPRKERKVPEAAIPRLRSEARDIWRYFETLVGEEDHWLPPDNFQETPEEVVAHRTSPTNIGFLLLANTAAWDFGYIGTTELVERTERTLATLTQLKTFNGHLYNWYDTRTLAPLEPRYVSTVDSGNLVGALIVLKQFALDVAAAAQPSPGRFDGVRDTMQKFLLHAQNRPGLSSADQKILQDATGMLRDIPPHLLQQLDLLERLNTMIGGIKLEPAADPEIRFWWDATRRVMATHLADQVRPQDLTWRLLSIAREAEEFAQEIDFRFLFDEARGVFSIGFNVTNGQLDPSHYDLLASEARLASFIAIAKGDVPQSHWFRMARPIASVGGRHHSLISWSGSMFEYLMPLLMLRSEPNTLLDETYREVVEIQQLYGQELKAPWGISEAGYNVRDVAMNYQYGPFGVPGLGLKRGLANDLVVAPYATFLAAMIKPTAAVTNLEHLEKLGLRGRYGFYESVDFSKERVPPSARFAVVKAFMAHHQGMSLLALDNLLHNDIVQRRFHEEPSVKATELLLQERVPLDVRSSPLHIIDDRTRLFRIAEPVVPREFDSPLVTPPRTQILSNGNYLVVITTGGSGYSECRGLRVTRWREDVTRDHWGAFCYLKDLASGRTWSAGFQPAGKAPSYYHVKFAEDRVEFRRRDGDVETHMDVIVSPEDDAEIRRITVVNMASVAKEIEITSYLEVVLTTAATDLAHPAFSNLFVETEFVSEAGALLASRRPRSSEELRPWAAHVIMCEGDVSGDLEYETDRSRFIGRTRSTRSPQALDAGTPLSNSTGAVLDPIFSLRRRIKIEPYSRAVVAFTTIIAKSREEATSLADKYRDPRAVARTFELASTHAQLMLHQLSLTPEVAHLFERLAGRLIYSDLSLRPRPAVLARNTRTQSALWPYGISGDLPICLVRVEDPTEIDIVRQLLQAHEYWRIKGFAVDLVILNEYPTSYFQGLQEDLQAAIRSSPSQAIVDKPGGIFLRRADLMPEEDKILLRTVARVQIVAQRGTLARQVVRAEPQDPLPLPHVPVIKSSVVYSGLEIPEPELAFDNGLGGFTKDGTEYVIRLKEGVTTPAPWINVISNSQFGFQISETGAGMTWSVNSRENRLTPWSNDAVADPTDSAIYIRDAEIGRFWSPTPAPARGEGTYIVSHGAGYSRFHYGGYGLEQELLAFVPRDAPVKILKLTLRNQTNRRRWLSVTHFAELVLGVSRSQSAPFVISSIDEETGALLSTNPYNNEFAGRIVFSAINDKKRTVTADRTVFLGPGGNPENPAAMSHAYLTGRVGAGLDPCAALQGSVRLDPRSEHTVIFLLGEGKNLYEARALVRQYSDVKEVDRAFERVTAEWTERLGAIQVQTPDLGMNFMLNRWLLYQTYACRFWARSAFYQSSGAYGFRDQLQDALAFVFSHPELTRVHIVRAAGRQFLEGDVQHWWHPPTGRGVRTRSSDDLLWLPYATVHYVHATGDTALLEEMVSFLEAAPLRPEEVEVYLQPSVSKYQASIYEHCCKAIDHSLQFGPHGLPLIGSGDWNDGMNRVGIQGRGESVWLGWFLVRILKDFANVCQSRNDVERASRYQETAEKIVQAIERTAWDGEWYRRGYDDEGMPLGSQENAECRIDSIAQSWAILSGAAEPGRARRAMASVEKLLILPDEGMALLLTPPFVHTQRDPGYIKGYLAGIRENGGQYTHAATWLIAAYAELGDGDRAAEIFRMINPISHSLTSEKAEKFKVEPYVAVGDIYAHPSHLGRGGWSWYTGSSAWLYRVGIEWILGFRLQGDHFTINPCIPKTWKEFSLTYRRSKSVYVIVVENPLLVGRGVKAIELDGIPIEGNSVPFDQEERIHTVRVVLGL